MRKKRKNESDCINIRTLYEKAQDSAEHYNTMTWSLISILLVGSLTIFYSAFEIVRTPFIRFIFFSGGLFILIYFHHLFIRADIIRLFNYKVCQKIEENYFSLTMKKLKFQPLLHSTLANKILKDSLFSGIHYILIGLFIITILFMIGVAFRSSWNCIAQFIVFIGGLVFLLYQLNVLFNLREKINRLNNQVDELFK
ncbi:MAG TPA: hypothetical protein VJB87_03930 [Candidatus Nanoarchaeia archaeon]|nr:hypothetical protein [Candidatus Nanoarchaeia archaeon]